MFDNHDQGFNWNQKKEYTNPQNLGLGVVARLAVRGNLAAGFGGRGRRLGGEGLVVGFKLVVVDVPDAAYAAAAAAVARERLLRRLRHRRGIGL
jgi:hypothetical protein